RVPAGRGARGATAEGWRRRASRAPAATIWRIGSSSRAVMTERASSPSSAVCRAATSATTRPRRRAGRRGRASAPSPGGRGRREALGISPLNVARRHGRGHYHRRRGESVAHHACLTRPRGRWYQRRHMAFDPAAVQALTFDVFGTVVDWRSSIIREGEALGHARGLSVDWARFADAWRGLYQPNMDRVRSGAIGWTKLDD